MGCSLSIPWPAFTIRHTSGLLCVALTDERVRWERAPFDHPQLFVPDGHDRRVEGNPKRARVLPDRIETGTYGSLTKDLQTSENSRSPLKKRERATSSSSLVRTARFY